MSNLFATQGAERYIAVFDDGIGMSAQGLANLWHIGHSLKRTKDVEERSNRKQIGKFGIGKLATYTIANRLTHISRVGTQILAVTVEFSLFKSAPSGSEGAIPVKIHVVDDFAAFAQASHVSTVLNDLGLDTAELSGTKYEHWTLALLEDLKEKSQEISLGTLEWVLSTAMPLRIDFSISLNGKAIKSSKATYETWVSFKMIDLPAERLKSLSDLTKKQWHISGDALISKSFPAGISGDVL